MTGVELGILTNKAKGETGQVLDELLGRCWTTSEPGPYGDSFDWDNAYAADIAVAMIGLRTTTFGDVYDFRTKCGEGIRLSCGKTFDYSINLSEELSIYEIPKESIESDELFDVFDFDGAEHQIRFKLLRGRDSAKTRKIARQRKRDNMEVHPSTLSLTERIISITKPDGSVIEKWNDRYEFILNAGIDEQRDLIDLLDDHDGGVETDIDIKCPHCGNEYSITLPFQGAEFWVPRKRSAKKKRARKARKARTMRDRRGG